MSRPAHPGRGGLDNVIVRGSPASCEKFSPFPGFYSLNIRNTYTHHCDDQECLQILPNIPWRDMTRGVFGKLKFHEADGQGP